MPIDPCQQQDWKILFLDTIMYVGMLNFYVSQEFAKYWFFVFYFGFSYPITYKVEYSYSILDIDKYWLDEAFK